MKPIPNLDVKSFVKPVHDSASKLSVRPVCTLFVCVLLVGLPTLAHGGIEDYYMDHLVWMIAGDHDALLSRENVTALLVKIGLEGMTHDHSGHNHDDHSGHDHHDDHSGHDHHDDHSSHNHHDDHSGHDHHHDDHSGHDHHHDDHSGHDHSGHDHHGHHHRKRAVANNQQESQANSSNECLSLDYLLKDFSYNPWSGLSKKQLWDMCPAFLNQLYSGVCAHSHHDDHHEHRHHGDVEGDQGRNMGLVWLYMMICVTLISLCAVWGILFIPKATRPSYYRVIQFLMALAAGTMAGDGLLHLLPHAMMPPHDHSAHGGHGGHDHSGHDHGGHGHDDHDDHDAAHLDALLKGLMAVIGVYAFFFLERLFAINRILSDKRQQRQRREAQESTIKMLPTLESDDLKTPNIKATEFDGMEHCANHHLESSGHGHSHSYNGYTVTPVDGDNAGKCPKLTALALMIVLGDLFHNFCDGLAIGAAFSGSTTLGLSTSIAVFCHELPHEIGDFAVLIQSGLSKKEAVFFNFVSALSCYLGAIIGIFLGDIGNSNLWIFAGVGGMFLYISLVDLIPEMTQAYITCIKDWKIFLSVHAGGLFLGAFFMFIIGLFEHDLQTILD